MFAVSQCAVARVRCCSVTRCAAPYSTVANTPVPRCATAGRVNRASYKFSRVSLTLTFVCCVFFNLKVN